MGLIVLKFSIVMLYDNVQPLYVEYGKRHKREDSFEIASTLPGDIKTFHKFLRRAVLLSNKNPVRQPRSPFTPVGRKRKYRKYFKMRMYGNCEQETKKGRKTG
jgi:hypothetical protein